MLTCTSGTIEEKKNGRNVYYWLRLNLVDDSATERKKRYQTKRIPTGLKVGGRTGRINNINLANEQLTQAIREFAPIGQDTQFSDYVKYWLAEIGKSHDLETSTKEAYKYKANYSDGKEEKEYETGYDGTPDRLYLEYKDGKWRITSCFLLT